jgi:Carboxypeptidase regulatory-like domain
MPRVIAPVLLLSSLAFSQTPGSVEGVVVDRVTRAGIPGASVTVYLRSQGLTYEATTDASGDFHIFGMKPGDYEVRFEKDGYRFGNKYPAQPYHVGQGQDPIRIRLEMTRLVSLSGRVTDPDGNPVSQAEVKIVGRNIVPVAADGTFVMKDLEPGWYTLAAIPTATAVPEGARAPVPTYTPEPIVVRGDADLSGYEIRLQTAEVYRVSGVLLDETGVPKAGVPVQLLPAIQTGTRVVLFGDLISLVGPGPSTGPEEARVVSTEDGSFEFPAVRSGEWKLAATSAGSIESADYAASVRSGALSVIVGNRNVTNLQIRLAAPVKVNGTLDWGEMPNRNARVFLLPLGGLSVMFGPTMAASSGTLSLRVAAAEKHLIVPPAGPGYYPVSVLLGGQEVLGKPVDLSADATFRVTYKAANGSVRGTVENGDGASVVLIPRNVQTMGFGRMVTSKADGTFDMSGVPPGDYFAAAFEQFRTFPITDAAWLARVASIGTRVSVAQSPVSVQLKLSRWPE